MSKVKKQELERAEDFVRKALASVSHKPVSETKVRAVAKKVLKRMAKVLVPVMAVALFVPHNYTPIPKKQVRQCCQTDCNQTTGACITKCYTC
jgi:hypothetical protein